MCSSLFHASHWRLEQPSPFQFNKDSIILALYLSLWNQIAFSSGISSRATSTSRDVLWTFGCLCKHISRCAHLFFTDSIYTQAPILISLTQGAYNSLPFLNQIPNSSVISTTARSTSRDVLIMNTSLWRLTMMYVSTFSNNFPFLHKHTSRCAQIIISTSWDVLLYFLSGTTKNQEFMIRHHWICSPIGEILTLCNKQFLKSPGFPKQIFIFSVTTLIPLYFAKFLEHISGCAYPTS